VTAKYHEFNADSSVPKEAGTTVPGGRLLSTVPLCGPSQARSQRGHAPRTCRRLRAGDSRAWRRRAWQFGRCAVQRARPVVAHVAVRSCPSRPGERDSEETGKGRRGPAVALVRCRALTTDSAESIPHTTGGVPCSSTSGRANAAESGSGKHGGRSTGPPSTPRGTLASGRPQRAEAATRLRPPRTRSRPRVCARAPGRPAPRGPGDPAPRTSSGRPG
jgi:hypothetical protein